LVLVIIKFLLSEFELEIISVNPLFTSLVAGGIFLFSLMLAGTLTDYKESEKLPAEISSACENIFQEAQCCKEIHPEFNLRRLTNTLCNIISGFKEDINSSNSRKALDGVNDLTPSLSEMEKVGVPLVYVSRLKNEQAIIRKSLLRFYYIQRINFLPSAYILVETVIILVLTLLLLSKIEPILDSMLIVFFLSYLFIYILKLLRVLERPFQKEGKTMDDVSLFLLEECERKYTGE